MADGDRCLADAVDRAIADALGEPALLIAAWLDPPVTPTPLDGRCVRAVYALPSLRLSTLRRWFDQVETALELDGSRTELVAWEALTWARLMLKGHGGALRIAAQQPLAERVGGGSTLRQLAPSLWTADSAAWAAAAGVAPLAPPSLDGPPARFDRVQRWLDAARRQADAATVEARYDRE